MWILQHFEKGLFESKQPVQEKPGVDKSYDYLLKNFKDILVPLKLRFFWSFPIDQTHCWYGFLYFWQMLGNSVELLF